MATWLAKPCVCRLPTELFLLSPTAMLIPICTGAVKITPSHDPNDYEMGIRHNLPSIVVIGMMAL